MSNFELNNLVTGNILIRAANRQHRLDAAMAENRIEVRAAHREAREAKRLKALNIALLVSTILGAMVAAATLCAVGMM